MTRPQLSLFRQAVAPRRSSALRAFGIAFALCCASGEGKAQPSQLDPQMQAVLDALKMLAAQPVHSLSVQEARSQASPADAALLVQRVRKISPRPEADVETRDIGIPTPNGALPARVYLPDASGPLPVVLYFHGGGWVVGDLNSYDATPRALTLGTGAIVVSADYRHAPESRFPAAHEDAWNVYAWLTENAASIGGDAKRIAVAGEGAGGNLAANVALTAKQKSRPLPAYQLLVYPIAGGDPNTKSYQENTMTRPLGRDDMEWFARNVLGSRQQAADPRINLAERDDLSGLPPATIVTAEFDPLRSEDEAFAARLKAAGVAVNLVPVTGVTHEFFGMGKVVDKAKPAVETASADLRNAFAKSHH